MRHTFGRREEAENEQQRGHAGHYRHRNLVALRDMFRSPLGREEWDERRDHQRCALGKEQAISIGRKTLLRISRQHAGQRDVRDGYRREHEHHHDVRRIRPDQFAAV